LSVYPRVHDILTHTKYGVDKLILHMYTQIFVHIIYSGKTVYVRYMMIKGTLPQPKTFTKKNYCATYAEKQIVPA